MRLIFLLFTLLSTVCYAQMDGPLVECWDLPFVDSTGPLSDVPSVEQELKLFPNTASDNTQLRLVAHRDAVIHMKLIDLGEQVLWEASYHAVRGENHFPISLYIVEPGWYWVCVELGGQGETFYLALLIER